MPAILIVDDCPVDRQLVGGLLRCVEGWEVHFAIDGQQAINALKDLKPQVVVTDMQMPNLDGLGLVSHIKENYSDIPVILITSFGSEEIAIESLKAGAASYTPKSALSRDLVRNVEGVLGLTERVQSVASDAPRCHHVEFELENDDKLVDRLIEHLHTNMPSWAEKDRIQIAMALHEAIFNAIHHGNLEVSSSLRDDDEETYYQTIKQRRVSQPFCDRRIWVKADFLDDQVQFHIEDQGPGFDPSKIADPTENENLEKLSGRGLLLIRSFMDEVFHNDQGNQITMVKKRSNSIAN